MKIVLLSVYILLSFCLFGQSPNQLMTGTFVENNSFFTEQGYATKLEEKSLETFKINYAKAKGKSFIIYSITYLNSEKPSTILLYTSHKYLADLYLEYCENTMVKVNDQNGISDLTFTCPDYNVYFTYNLKESQYSVFIRR